ncbi:MAG: ATP-binding protein, partial [Kofleriaceae bacterium]
MRASPSSLGSGTSTFDRAGRRFISVEHGGIAIVDLARSETCRIECSDARAIVAFDDQLWVATAANQLVRMSYTGRVIGTPVALDFAATAVLVPAACGAPAAMWASAPAQMIVEDAGRIVCDRVDADVVIPLTGRRQVIARGARLLLPSKLETELLPGTIVLGGSVTTDGKTVVLLATHAGERQLIVVSLGTGKIVHRCVTPSQRVRVAMQRLVAISQLDPRQLCAVDLRTGRELGTVVSERDVIDFAISPDGETLVTHVDDCIEVHELAALDKKRTVAVAAELPELPEVAVEVKAEVEVVVEPAVSPGVAAPLVVPALLAFAPRAVPAAVDREATHVQLDRELASVALWTLKAIAIGWDTRRIGYGNESKHPFELEVAAILGIASGHATDLLTAARTRLVEHEATIAEGFRGADTAVGALVRELDLSPVAVDVLVVIAAAALWGEGARLYSILANDANRPLVDELIVQQVLGHRHDRHAIAEALDPRAPLVRLGLVQMSAKRPRPFCELSVAPIVLDLLRGLAPSLGDATAIRTSDRTLLDLELPRSVLESALAALSDRTNAARVLVRGRAGSGRKTLLAALVACANRELAVIDARALPRQAEAFVIELRQALRHAHIAGYVPCLVDLEEITFDERSARDVAAETLRLHPGPIAAVTTTDSASPFPAGHISIAIPVLAETERCAIWVRALAESDLRANADLLAARYRIGAGAIRRAVAAARTAADPMAAIEAYIRQTRDQRLGQYARRVDRLASWNTVVFPSDILDSLRELVGRVRHGKTVFDAWGMSKTMQTSRGLTALFQGPPGTGKTLVAGVIARELGLDLYQVDLSKVMSKWIGETERNLAAIFDAAEDGQVILLFDEADSLFAKRTEVRSSNDRYANLEVNYLLQRLDSFEGIAILTTNIGTSIDQAFKRRMSFRLSFPFPDEETRAELWRAHLPPELPIAGVLTLDALARKYQLSGGYIRNACLRAAFLA